MGEARNEGRDGQRARTGGRHPACGYRHRRQRRGGGSHGGIVGELDDAAADGALPPEFGAGSNTFNEVFGATRSTRLQQFLSAGHA